MLQINVAQHRRKTEPVVITGIGLVTSVGSDREASWRSVCRGESGVRRLDTVPHLRVPRHLGIGAVVDCAPRLPKQLKVIHLNHLAAEEALGDSGLDLEEVDAHRCACAVSGHMGDWRWLRQHHGFERSAGILRRQFDGFQRSGMI